MRRLALLFLVLGGCPNRTKDHELEPVAELFAAEGGEEPLSQITVQDFRRALARMRLERDADEAGELPKELPPFVLDQLIEQRVLALEAEHLGVKVSTVAVAREVAVMRRALPEHRFERFLVETYQTEKDLERAITENLVSAQLLAKEAKVELKEDELKQAWDQLPEEQRVRHARVHAAQIVVATEDAATAIVKQLHAQKPADFAQLAKENSIAPEAERGGDLGWFEKGDMPAVFDQVCFALDPGQISDVTPSELGYHVFKVIQREEERPMTFDEAKPMLTERLSAERLRERELAVKKSLVAKYRVVRHEERIASIR